MTLNIISYHLEIETEKPTEETKKIVAQIATEETEKEGPEESSEIKIENGKERGIDRNEDMVMIEEGTETVDERKMVEEIEIERIQSVL